MTCHRCGKEGHFSKDCSQKSTYAGCNKCGSKSHLARNCTSSPVQTSTIECYDCRQQVVDLKSHKANDCRKFGGGFNPSNSIITTTSTSNNIINPTPVSITIPIGNYGGTVPQSVTTTITLPISIASPSITPVNNNDFYLLFDESMSGTPLDNLKQCATNILERLNPSDRMSIITFDNKAFFKLKPRAVGKIKRKNELPSILSSIFAKGSTALYDAIWLCVDEIRDKSIKSFIVVLTDGDDNSSKHTYQQVLDRLAQFPNLSLNIIQINGSKPIDQFQALCNQFNGSFNMTTPSEITVTFDLVFSNLTSK